MTKKQYAHSKENRPVTEWQRLEDHLHQVAERASFFAEKFHSADWAWNSAWLHDLGKAADEFQAYLLRANGLDDSEYDKSGKINHSSAGAAYAQDFFGTPLNLVYSYLAAGHHAGLPDFYSFETGSAALTCRLEEGKTNLLRIREAADELGNNLRRNTILPPFVKKDNFHLWIRLLFSCLVDADYLDTESFMNPDRSMQRSSYPLLPELKQKFDIHMENMTSNASKKEVNKIRNNILSSCRSAANQPSGLFTLDVPTGGGKTLSSMAFALDHAVKYKKDRIIYVIPYTSIIEQTAKILSDIFGSENIIEHHSNIDSDNETQRTRLASENWDAPVIVTTNVQFFESLYAAKPGRCRKLHNIVNSVVILDEAQLMPPSLLDPCVNAIKHLTRHYDVTMVLATATQPILPQLDDSPYKIISDPSSLYQQLKRTELVFPEDLKERVTWEKMSEQLANHDQVLCVVNTRRDCYDLFRLMPEGTVHLSALMCGEHRSEVIQKIKQALTFETPIRVISTQLVEAGVDIDFPVVYRALAGIDSIVQAAGRCNREGELNKTGKLGKVHVFVPPKSAPAGLLRKGEDTTIELMSHEKFNPQHPDTFTRYFSLFYSKLNDTGKRFKEWFEDEAADVRIHFRTASKDFNMINESSQPLFVNYKESNIWLDELRYIGPTRQNIRKLQRFTVNVSQHDFENMKKKGILEEIRPGFWTWLGPYNPVFGLDLFGHGWAPEDLYI